MSTFHIVLLLIGTHAIAFVVGALVFRNNINSFNKLIQKGEVIVDATGKLIKKS